MIKTFKNRSFYREYQFCENKVLWEFRPSAFPYRANTASSTLLSLQEKRELSLIIPNPAIPKSSTDEDFLSMERLFLKSLLLKY